MTIGNDTLSNLMAGRIETSALLVSLAVGIFGILTLIKDYEILSLTWDVLTGLYLATVFAIWLVFRSWAWHSILVERFSQESERSEIDRIMEQVKKKPVMRFAVADFSKKASGQLENVFIPVSSIGIIVMALLLWVAIAFH